MKTNLIFSALAIVGFIVCFPVVFIFTGSLMAEGELIDKLAPIIDNEIRDFVQWSIFPQQWSIDSYEKLILLEPRFFVMFWNTAKICIGVLVGQCIFAVPGAWGFAMYDFPLKKSLFTTYIIFMMFPFQVLMLPEYVVLSKMNLINSLWAVILPGIFSTLLVFIIYNFFRSIPRSAIEAARLDGASELTIFLRIGIPQSLTGIVASMILQFLECWNMVEQPMIFIEDEVLMPLSLYLPRISFENIGISFVAALISLIPSLLIFRLGHKALESGIAAITVRR